jgi:hypothetical protein
MEQSSSSSSSSSSSKKESLDVPLHSFGFQIEELSPQKVTGRLLVTPKCVQVCPSPPLSLSLSLYNTFIRGILFDFNILKLPEWRAHNFLLGNGLAGHRAAVQGITRRSIGVDFGSDG